MVPKSARTFVYLGWLANVASAMGVSVIIHLFPHLATELEISAPIHGLMVATNRSVVIIIYSLMFWLTFWRYRFSAALLAQLCALAGLTLLASSRTVPFLTLGLILFALLSGYNYFSSIFYSTTTFDRRRQGLASGMHEASLAVGFARGLPGRGPGEPVAGAPGPLPDSGPGGGVDDSGPVLGPLEGEETRHFLTRRHFLLEYRSN